MKPVLSEEQYVISRCRKALICLCFLSSAPVFQLCVTTDSTSHINTSSYCFKSSSAELFWSFLWDTSSSSSTQKALPLALFISRKNGSSPSSCPAFTVMPSSQNGDGDQRRFRSAKQPALIPPAAQLDGIYILSKARLRKGHLHKTRSLTCPQFNTECKQNFSSSIMDICWQPGSIKYPDCFFLNNSPWINVQPKSSKLARQCRLQLPYSVKHSADLSAAAFLA